MISIVAWRDYTLTSTQALGVASGFVSLYVLGYAIYNLYFHPLAKFPGPVLARSSLLWRMFHSMQGRFHRTIEICHQQYGPVFRVSPNELSFASVKSWKGIYGPWAGGEPFLKTDFYDIYGAGFNSPDLASTRDVAQHNRMKRSLAGGFSAKALLEQEPIVQKCVDLFISKIGVNGGGPKGINMTEWYEMVAFDVLGEMAFGKSFHCVEKEEPHFWQQMTVKHLFFITVVDNLRRYPLVRRLGQAILPSLTVSVRDKHTAYSREQVASRITNTSGRKDILTHVISKVEAGEISQEELTAHSSTLVLAGGETVGTFMSAVTFYLCKYPGALRKLQKEVRDRYQSYEQIDALSAMQLPYLQAVINEGLRIYPPASQGFPRYSPGAMVDGYYIPKGTELYTSAWSVTHDPANFHLPNDFIPERWIDPNCTDVKEASQPFSLGPRGCIGRNFAYVEMSLLLAKIHFKYELVLLDKNLDWEGQSHMHVMWWKPQLRIKVLPRSEDKA